MTDVLRGPDSVEGDGVTTFGPVPGAAQRIRTARDLAQGRAVARASRLASAGPRARRWERSYAAQLVAADAVSAAAAVAVAWASGLGISARTPWDRYLAISLVACGCWLACLQLVGAYEIRRVSTAPREIQRVLRASANLAGVTAVVAFLGQVEVGRSLVGVMIPIGVVFIVAARWGVRRRVLRRRAHGEWTSAILAVGTSESVRHLAEATQRNPLVGLVVVGACVEDAEPGGHLLPGVPILSDVAHAAEVAEQVGADIVAVAGSGLGPQRIRELSWALEGTGRNMVLAPGLTDVAGPRLHISPVEGLPLMWVDQPQFSGVARLAKRAMDLVGGTLLLIFGAPFLLGVGLLVRFTSPGAALYRSTRLGANGREFVVYKFRSMYSDADQRRHELAARNESDGLLFKMRCDPRVTPVGRFLRKYSLDELPQLLNVLRGSMSLVGPRPPLPDEVERYAGHVHRRMLVKPGMTGLWQVSGRSDLAWDESVRLDLYYVENWSLGLDFAIIARTVGAVLRSRGAY